MKTVGDVVAHMRGIEAGLDPRDGVACFATLYRITTEAVGAALDLGELARPDVLIHLDVVFARYFFDALEAWKTAPETTPRAWAALFEVRSLDGIAPLQFAVAGMNAHINRDLALSLVDTWTTYGAPGRDSAEHQDYLFINTVLVRAEQTAKAVLSKGMVHVADDALGNVDDSLALWSVAKARAQAWNQAEVLWALRDMPSPVLSTYREGMDRLVGFAGRALLMPRGILS